MFSLNLYPFCVSSCSCCYFISPPEGSYVGESEGVWFMMMFTDCPPQFSLSGLGCKPSPSAFPGGLSLDELRPPSNHHPAPLSAWPHISFPVSPPLLPELGLQEIPVAIASPLSWEFPSRRLLPPLILKIFWKKITGLRSMSREADLQLSIVVFKKNLLINMLHPDSSDEGSILCVANSLRQITTYENRFP